MAKATFTVRWVTSVKPPAEGQVDYFDTKPPSLGLRVSNSGRKPWFIIDIIKVYRVAWSNAPLPSDGGVYAKR
jgi:hypothetical protein